MLNRKQEILNGELSFPQQIMDIINPLKEEEKTILILEFWNNCWHNFLKEKSVDSIGWFIRFNDKDLYNNLLMHLSKSGWITSSFENKYAYIDLNESKLLKWITKEELINVKFQYKFLKYRLKHSKSTLSDIVQNNNKYEKTGLIRKGFMKAGNTKFRYDTKYLKIYMDYIAANIKKGLVASTKDITYQEIISELLEWYSVDGTEYTLGNCLIDSRGRAIYNCSKKVFNPVSNKDARALLICPPQELTREGLRSVYAAIAELNSYRGINYNDKVSTGLSMYLLGEMPDLIDMDISQNYDNLHIRIWLERIYENLNNYDGTNWTVPIEIDATASLIQFYGVLTNDYEYMKRTNLIETEDGFQDIWTVSYVSRNHVKKAMTPQLYGSNKHAKELWDHHKLEYNQIQVNKMEEELTTGLYANANNFKYFIIENVKPKTKMKVKIWNEEFWIECNRFKWEETSETNYYIYTSSQGLLKRVTKESHLVPDLQQFKRYFVTLLIFIMWVSINSVNCWNAKSEMICQSAAKPRNRKVQRLFRKEVHIK